MNEHEMRPGIVDDLTNDVMDVLLSTDNERIGWLLLGDIEQVHPVRQIRAQDSVGRIRYFELDTCPESDG
jgi:hypothetical protein